MRGNKLKKKKKKSMRMVLPVGSKKRTWCRKYSFHPTGEKDTLRNKASLFGVGYYIVILLLRVDADRVRDALLLKYICFVLYGETCCSKMIEENVVKKHKAQDRSTNATVMSA